MRVEYRLSNTLDITLILCDRCGVCVWKVIGSIVDSSLKAGHGSTCLCGRCAHKYVAEAEPEGDDCPL